MGESKKKDIITTVIIITLGISIGAFGGSFLGNGYFAGKNGIDYSSMSIDDFEDDTDALMSKYSSTNKAKYISEFQPYELVSIGLGKIKTHDYVVQQSFGEVNAMGVKQTVRATSIKENNSYFLENLSTSSMVQVAKRFYQNGDEIKTYDASSSDKETATWKTDPISTLNAKEHEDKWGKELSRPSIYIVSSKTTLPSSKAEKTATGYSVSLDLHPVYSVLRYVKQMVEISGVESPRFQSINIVFDLDEDLNLIKTSITEHYSVVMVVKAESDATLTEYFTYDQHSAIPDLNTNITYAKGE